MPYQTERVYSRCPYLSLIHHFFHSSLKYLLAQSGALSVFMYQQLVGYVCYNSR